MSVMWSTTSSSIMAMVSGAGVSSPKPYIIGATVCTVRTFRSVASRSVRRSERTRRAVFGEEALLGDLALGALLGTALLAGHAAPRVARSMAAARERRSERERERERERSRFPSPVPRVRRDDARRSGPGRARAPALHIGCMLPLERQRRQIAGRPRCVRFRSSHRALELGRESRTCSARPRSPVQADRVLAFLHQFRMSCRQVST